MNTQTLSPRHRAQADYLNLTLWTLQGWLALFFIAAGYTKLAEPMARLTDLMRWPALVSESLVRGLGLAEITLAVLMLAPLVSWRFGRSLLIVAAAGLIGLEATMLIVHVIGGDAGLAATNALLLGITAPVLWFRARPGL
jgi:hypothetical protein